MAFYLSGHQGTRPPMARPTLATHSLMKSYGYQSDPVRVEGGSLAANLSNALDPHFSNTVNKAVKDFGDWVIVGTIRICRAPIASMVKKALDIMSLGAFKKAREEAGGELYHLFIQLQLQSPTGKNTYMQLEKNEVISIKTQNKPFPFKDQTSFQVPPEPKLTFGRLMEDTEERMGDKFFVYDAASNNCQHFIMAVTESIYAFYFPTSGGVSDLMRHYIFQPVEEAMKKIYAVNKVGKKLTDLAGFGRRLFGFGLVPGRDEPGGEMSSSDEE